MATKEYHIARKMGEFVNGFNPWGGKDTIASVMPSWRFNENDVKDFQPFVGSNELEIMERLKEFKKQNWVGTGWKDTNEEKYIYPVRKAIATFITEGHWQKASDEWHPDLYISAEQMSMDDY